MAEMARRGEERVQANPRVADSMRGATVAFARQVEEEDDVLLDVTSPLKIPGKRGDRPSSAPIAPADVEERKRAEDQQAFKRDQAAMEKLLRDLKINIAMKESFIGDLEQDTRQSQQLNQQYMVRIREMEKEEQGKQAQLDGLNRELQEVSEEMRASRAQEKRGLQYALETLKKKHADQIRKLKRDVSSPNIPKHTVEKEELQRMKSQEVAIKKRLQEAADTHEAKAQSQLREVRHLQKEVLGQQKRMQDLETVNEHQRKVLKRKSEEAMQARKKLQGSEGESKERRTSERAGPDTPKAWGTPKVQEPESRPRTAPDLKHKEAWLHREIEKYMVQKEAVVQATQEERRRQRMLDDKEGVSQQKTELEMRMVRGSQQLASKASKLGDQLERLDDELQHKGVTLLRQSQNRSQRENASLTKLEADIAALTEERNRVYKKRIELEVKISNKEFLRPPEQEALRACEERLEALDAEIEYKSDRIAETAKADDTADDTESFLQRTAMVIEPSENEVGLITRKYVEMAIELKEGQREREDMKRQQDYHLEEHKRQVQELEALKAQAEDAAVMRLKKVEEELARIRGEQGAWANQARHSDVRRGTSRDHPGSGTQGRAVEQAALRSPNRSQHWPVSKSSPPTTALRSQRSPSFLSASLPRSYPEPASPVSGDIVENIHKVLTAKEQQIANLDRDLYHHKELNRSLSRQLAEMSTAFSSNNVYDSPARA
jgi:hypothetical protein